MGVDSKIYVPADVRLDDLVKMMGVAAGFPKEKVPCGKSFYVKVQGMETEAMKNMWLSPTIHFNHLTIDGQYGHYVMFHTECSDKHGQWKLLMPRSTPFWIAMGKKVIKTFGGTIDCDDCDESGIDFRCKKPRKWNDPEDGKEWEELQQAIWDVKPITQEDMIKVRHLASYDVGIGVDLEKAQEEFDKFRKGKDKDVESIDSLDNLEQIAEKMMEE